MSKHFLTFILVLAFLLPVFNTSNAQDKIDGKEVYEKAKCSNCHSVNSLNMEGKKKDKSHDLSNAGKNHTADELKKYLKKESKWNDKNHPIAFKGEEAELDALVEWLMSLKQE